MSPSGTYLDSAVLDRVLDVLLSRSGSVALALTDAAVRVRLPDDPRLDRVAGLPMERETVVDLVVPVDMHRADEAMYRSKRRRDRTPVFLRMSTDRIPAPASAAETTIR